ncbi:MAG: alpha/beta hydrolase [bacterium]
MRRPMYAVLLLLILTVSHAAQVKPATNVDVIPDVVYGHKDGMALTFDIFKPKTHTNGAAIIFMVSGGWISNYVPPDQALPRYHELLDAGFTVITLRHGGSPKYLIPEIVADVRRGVRFIRYNARRWGIDPNRLGVYGGSAGGHLSLMIGLASDNGDPSAKEDFMKESDRVAAVVAYFPPVDLRPFVRGLNAPPTGTVIDRFPALNFEKERAADFSPLLFVTSDDPPTLLIHGDKDQLVNISNSQIIFDALKKNNVKTDFITIPGADHGFRGEDAKRAMAATVSWFEHTLVKN